MEATAKKRPGRAAKIAFWSFVLVAALWVTGAWVYPVRAFVEIAYGGWCGTIEQSVIDSHNGSAASGQPKMIAIAEQKLLESQDGNLSCTGIALMSNQEKLPIAFRVVDESGMKLVHAEFTQ